MHWMSHLSLQSNNDEKDADRLVQQEYCGKGEEKT